MMRRLIIATFLLAAGAGVAAAADGDSHWDGRVRLGGIYFDETGDATTMPETYNVYDGFSLSSLYLKGYTDPRTHLLLDLTNINQDARRGNLDFRRSGMLHLTSRYNESRWIFDPAGTVDANRKNWYSSLSVTPSKSLWFSANYGLQMRDGDRIGLTTGPEGWLGTQYDSKLHSYRLEAQARNSSGIGGTVAYDGVAQRDALNPDRERDGYVASANLNVSGLMTDRITHVVRGAIGRNEVRTSGLGFDLKSVQYTGVVRATDYLRLKYRFDGSHVDDEATTIRTDDYHHDIDATVNYRIAVISAGYGWEALDDDRAITTTNKFRGALSLRHPKNKVSGRIAFDTRNKDDKEATTLLRDTEYSRVDVRVDANPTGAVAVGARFSDRTRDLPDLGTTADGTMVTAYGAWHQLAGDDAIAVTEVGVDYTFADDEYGNLYGSEHIVTHVVTGRVGVTVFENLDLTGAVTYLSASEDLDLDKSIISVGAGYHFPRGFLADVKYNVYNYDDYLLTDRFYTANVVWFNVGYEFSTR
ncbi:MAG TPA: hypothetical protein VFX92_10920 [Candidatus Krumholzibacteria bacterium]|nr:hypothetical protein [Candidatus Krumholzibacteria bacterium]